MALSEKAYAENKMTKWKTKFKTSATRYTRKTYVEWYLEKPVLGSAPCTVSWVGALAFDPTSLPSGSWNVTPAAKGKKQKEGEQTDRNTQGPEKKNQRPEPGKETPARPTRTGRKPDTKAVSLFDLGVPVLGSAPFARF